MLSALIKIGLWRGYIELSETESPVSMWLFVRKLHEIIHMTKQYDIKEIAYHMEWSTNQYPQHLTHSTLLGHIIVYACLKYLLVYEGSGTFFSFTK